MKENTIALSIGLLYGQAIQGPIYERMVSLRKLLLDMGKIEWIERWEPKKQLVTIQTAIPLIEARKHHGFDSKINRGWPGIGAAWLVEE